MHIEFIREKSSEMPLIDSPESVKSARIWHCNFNSFEQLKRCNNLETLLIASLPESNFDFLGNCHRIKHLDICHLPHVTELSTLKGLNGLESLILQTLPSWDSSGKVQVIESLLPISSLPKLKYLELFGVRPGNKSPLELLGSNSLQSVRFSKYSKKEINEYYKQSGVRDDYAPEPVI